MFDSLLNLLGHPLKELKTLKKSRFTTLIFEKQVHFAGLHAAVVFALSMIGHPGFVHLYGEVAEVSIEVSSELASEKLEISKEVGLKVRCLLTKMYEYTFN